MRGPRAAATLLAATLSLAAAGCAPKAPVPDDGLRFQAIDFADLEGWAADDHAAAFDVFRRSCDKGRTGHPALGVTREDWAAVCDEAGLLPRDYARDFFEARFRPYLVTSADRPLFTAYYEPELQGARAPVGAYRHPLYARPPDLPRDGDEYWTRAEIEAGALDGRGLELFWLADPVESFFLHIQGSGRIRTEDGRVHRLGYAGKNGHPYRSVGRMLIADGVLTPGQASAEGIKAWVRANPAAGRAYLDRNPSYVFFREITALDPSLGPLGALETPLTPYRSAAVDPSVYPLGAPVWVEAPGPAGPFRRLMVAQDTGGVIKGAQRADLFFGTGPEAGALAGRMKHAGRMVVLAPRAADLRVAALE